MSTHQLLKHEEGALAWEEYAPAVGGAPILLVPGIGDLRAEYRFLAPLLAEGGLRPISLDLRGTGDSSVGWQEYTPEAVGRDMLALARTVDAGPVWLAGCSMAAASAVWAAVEAPELVKGIVLLGPSLETPVLTGGQKAALALGLHGPWKVRFWEFFYRSLYPVRKPADLDDYCRTLRANLAQPGRFDALRAFMSAPKTASEERIEQLTKPSLVIMGARDPDFKQPEAKAHEYATRLRGAHTIIRESGHYPHVDSAPEVAAAILRWAQEIEGGEDGTRTLES